MFFHLVQIVIHTINAILVLNLLNRLKFNENITIISTLIFALHPVLTQAVSYVSGLGDPLYLLFLLISIHLFIILIKTDRIIYCFLVPIFLLLSVLSKETGVIGFLVISAIYLYLSKNKYKINKPTLTILAAGKLSLIYLILRFTVLSFNETGTLTIYSNAYTESLVIRLITFISILWDYFVLIFIPKDLYYEKPYFAYNTILSIRFIFGFILILLSLWFSYRSYKKGTALWLGICFFWVFLLPVTGIVPLNAMYLEHWLYGAFIGIAIIVATILQKIMNEENKKIIYVAVAIILLLFSFRTFSRNIEWGDHIKFYSNGISYNQNSARIYNNLAMALAREERHDEAINHYLRAIKLFDVYPQTHYNLSNSYFEKGETEKAIESLYKSLKIDPNFIYSHYSLYNFFHRNNFDLQADRMRELINKIENGGVVTIEEVENALTVQE